MAQDDFGWLSHQQIAIGGVTMLAIRVSFAGEAGWELHMKMEDVVAVYDRLMAVWKDAQSWPFWDAGFDLLMRLEKGY